MPCDTYWCVGVETIPTNDGHYLPHDCDYELDLEESEDDFCLSISYNGRMEANTGIIVEANIPLDTQIYQMSDTDAIAALKAFRETCEKARKRCEKLYKTRTGRDDFQPIEEYESHF